MQGRACHWPRHKAKREWSSFLISTSSVLRSRTTINASYSCVDCVCGRGGGGSTRPRAENVWRLFVDGHCSGPAVGQATFYPRSTLLARRNAVFLSNELIWKKNNKRVNTQSTHLITPLLYRIITHKCALSNAPAKHGNPWCEETNYKTQKVIRN